MERQQPCKLTLVRSRRYVTKVEQSISGLGIAQDASLVLGGDPVITPTSEVHNATGIVCIAVDIYREPVLPQVENLLALQIEKGHGHLRPHGGVIFEANGISEQRFLQQESQFTRNLPAVIRAAGSFISVGTNTAGIEHVVVLRHAVPGELLQYVIEKEIP
tara:strand:- start:848 stop:1330 length:483 start_codon:yes stop_codon:yes gene_type:complete